MLAPARPLAAALLLAISLLAAEPAKEQTYQPKAGMVPNAETANAIAYAVGIPVYGKATMDREQPFHAELTHGVWTVNGSQHCEACFGGVITVKIRKRDGTILHLVHGK